MPPQNELVDVEPGLTICSVSFYSKFCLDLNWELTRQLNSTADWSWIVVENSPEKSGDTLQARDSRFHVVNGSANVHSGPGRGSYHHAAGLGKSLEYVRTRFALFLDPDFYIVRERWIGDVTRYMDREGLSFFGAPYHPKWIGKYRYFPSLHCLFVDLSKISRDDLDYTPAMREAAFMEMIRRRFLKRFFGPRALVGISRDTGYRIYRRSRRDRRIRHECVTPVLRPRQSDPDGGARSTSLGKGLAKLIPDGLSLVPKKPGYFTETGFRDLGFEDVSAVGWEEYLWKGEPFGFHLRWSSQDPGDQERDRRELARVIQKTTERVPVNARESATV